MAGAALSLFPFVTSSSSGCLIVGTVESGDQLVLEVVQRCALHVTRLVRLACGRPLSLRTVLPIAECDSRLTANMSAAAQ